MRPNVPNGLTPPADSVSGRRAAGRSRGERAGRKVEAQPRVEPKQSDSVESANGKFDLSTGPHASNSFLRRKCDRQVGRIVRRLPAERNVSPCLCEEDRCAAIAMPCHVRHVHGICT